MVGPRRLLVQLRTDSNAADLLAAAKKLKYCDSEFARSVYINRDLSPTEAKMAFERRQKLREQRAAASAVCSVSLSDSHTSPGTDNCYHQQAATTDVAVNADDTDSTTGLSCDAHVDNCTSTSSVAPFLA